MTRRVVWLVVATTTLAVLALLVPASLAVHSRNLHASRLELQREASMMASSILPDEPLSIASVEEVDNGQIHDVGIYNQRGFLVGGEGPNVGDDAVIVALSGGFGETADGDEQVAAVPVPRNDGGMGALRVSEEYEDPSAASRRQVLILMALAGSIVVLAGLLGSASAKKLTAPLRDLQRAANAIGRGELTTEVPETGLAELDDLGRTLTTSATLVQGTVARERAFSNEVSHQLRTPLAALRVAVETELAFPRPDHELVLNEVLGAVTRLEQTTSGLLSLALGTIDDRTELDLADVARVAVERWTPTYALQHRQLRSVIEVAPAWMSRTAADQILDVLLENALQHGRGHTVDRSVDERGGILAVGPRRRHAGNEQGPVRRTGERGRTRIGLSWPAHWRNRTGPARTRRATTGHLRLTVPSAPTRHDDVEESVTV
ncbi:MAG: HAMP domain-containing sensor histidine kinase [Ilumatobacteraceae bacterium]